MDRGVIEGVHRSVVGIALVGMLVGTTLGAPSAFAEVTTSTQISTDTASDDGSHITDVEYIDDRYIRLQVHSAAMDAEFPVEIQRAADDSVPRPTLYLLNGAGGGEDDASWQAQSDARQFMSDKNVNLVQPIGGKFSYYTDWLEDDPVLGRNKWKTYLTDELPPLINAALGTNGVNAIAGISASTATVLALPIARPDLYRAAAAYSGCAQTSDPIGSRFLKLVIAWGGGNADNMWGPVGSPEWMENDPYLHADKLRGIDLYLSSGNGLPGKYDTLNGAHAEPGLDGLTNQVLLGGAIEAAANYCMKNLQAKLISLGIPATYNFDEGTHSWGYWEDELKRSWPVLAHGLGLT
ncbi:alpha/beta hydrolase [Nocardia vinacea]|uniref:alpha/beta hydrolase n=1 Tax=Nocardia vinacea TaxID=96468 RepID=UPI003F4D45F8